MGSFASPSFNSRNSLNSRFAESAHQCPTDIAEADRARERCARRSTVTYRHAPRTTRSTAECTVDRRASLTTRAGVCRGASLVAVRARAVHQSRDAAESWHPTAESWHPTAASTRHHGTRATVRDGARTPRRAVRCRRTTTRATATA